MFQFLVFTGCPKYKEDRQAGRIEKNSMNEAFIYASKYNMVMRYYIECYLEFCFCLALNLSILTFEGKQNLAAFSNVLSIVFGVVVFTTPLFFLSFVNEEEKTFKGIEDEYATVYLGFNKNATGFSKLYPFLFCLRRMVMALSIVFLAASPTLQIFLCLLFSSFMLMFFYKTKPYEDGTFYYVQLWNEWTIWVCTMLLLPFTDWIADH